MILFSDDSIVTGKVNGVPFLFNVDISSCDANQRSPIAAMVVYILSTLDPELAMGLFKQICSPIHIANPHNQKERMDVKFASSFMGSGTTLTTIMNNTANACVGIGILVTLAQRQPETLEAIESCILYGARFAGHKVTVDYCGSCSADLPHLQFLKNSPVRNLSGSIITWQNWGTIFRGLGTCDGRPSHRQLAISAKDFKRISEAQKMEILAGVVVSGMVHMPHDPVIDALRDRFPLVKYVDGELIKSDTITVTQKEMLRYDMDDEDLSHETVDVHDICTRYNITTGDIVELTQHISCVSLGQIIHLDILSRIFHVDYGLPLYKSASRLV
jgi:hypothetical protein